MADQATAIQQFVEITGASEAQARFFLSASKWDMNLAVTSFFQKDSAETSEGPEEPAQSTSVSVPAQRLQRIPSQRGNIATLGSIGDPMDEDSDSETDNPEYFAGGEKSGLSLQDPKKKRDNTIQDILRKAAQAPELSENDNDLQTNHFAGTGHTLGGEDKESTVVNPQNERPSRHPKVTRILNFWKDGISVDDGPLLRYDDPANESILNDINSGRAPMALLGVEYGQPVDVNINKQLDQEFKALKKLNTWEGSGYRLGSQIPDEPAPAASFPSAPAPVEHLPFGLELTDGQPVTSVQIRLSDGTRIVSRVNLSHTVGDLYKIINMFVHATVNNSKNTRSRPDMAPQNFVLQSSFPMRELNDRSQSIQDAKLQNAVVVQKMT
ncbi:UBX domain-containing protein 1 [Neolecta irregularis DAH-3]|uniref:UBX domain-containing protein 1 n=1 Tax=Neolecta irregularis (strain DAH-3) TaxID=1198029 RepID=A0A1U7LUK6_NEOID|nr:UBX domain-containing protein 1 [Neolecta irregularis DAH-3]|eukprot:OLL26347.1 UBX domain-containing protein 1 [Neolecta irregularis DAH-3]